MGRAGTAAILLLLLVAAPSAVAQVHHEDHARAQNDDRVLRIFAGLVLTDSVDVLNASLDLDHEQAETIAAGSTARAEAMSAAAAKNLTEATSTQPLRALAGAAGNLSSVAAATSADWRELDALTSGNGTTEAGVVRAKFLLRSLEASLDRGEVVADEYDSLGYDTTALRDAIARFRPAFAEREAHVATFADTGPFLLLEVVPRDPVVTKPFEVRGLLFAPDADRAQVDISIDRTRSVNVTVDDDGFFSVRLTSDAADIGPHVAQARAAGLVSDEVAYEILRYPTQVLLAISRTAEAGPVLEARLLDADGIRLHGRPLTIRGSEGIDEVVLVTGADGGVRLELPDQPDAGLEAIVSFGGDAFYAPSEARLLVEASPPIAPTVKEPAPVREQVPVLALLLLILLHLVALEALGRRAFRRGFLPLLVAGPILVAYLAWIATTDPAVAAIGFIAGAAGSLAMGRRHRELLPRRSVAPALEPSVSAAPAESAAAPPTAATIAPASTAVVGNDAAAHPPRDSLDELLRLWAHVLERARATGIDVAPLTLRELTALLLQRRWAEAPLRTLSRAVERALYAGEPPRAEDVPSYREAAQALEGAS